MAISVTTDDIIVKNKNLYVRYGFVKPGFSESLNIWAKGGSIGTEDVHFRQYTAAICVHNCAVPSMGTGE